MVCKGESRYTRYSNRISLLVGNASRHAWCTHVPT